MFGSQFWREKKEKERKGKGRKGKEGKRNEREVTLAYLGGKGKKIKGDGSFPFKSFFENIDNFYKNHQFNPSKFLLSKSFPFHFVIQTRDPSSLQMSPLSFFHLLPSKHTLYISH